MNNLRRKEGKNKGFSLVELIIVIAILAILVGVLAPQYIKYVEKSRKSTDAANIDSFLSAIKVAAADTDYPKVLQGQTYKVTMNRTGTVVTPGTAGSTDLEDAFNEAVGGEWEKTKMKSNGWTNTTGGTTSPATEISVDVAIASDGGIVVTYTPDSLATFLNK